MGFRSSNQLKVLFSNEKHSVFVQVAQLLFYLDMLKDICLVPIYVFPEMKLLFPKQNYNALSPSSYTHISVRDSYISRIRLPILLQGCSATAAINYPSLRDTPNDCQGHPRPCLSPPDRPLVTGSDSNDVLTPSTSLFNYRHR
jgi:hypothetical protein